MKSPIVRPSLATLKPINRMNARTILFSVALIAGAYWIGSQNSGPIPGPSPANVEAIAEVAGNADAANRAKAYREVAGQIEAGRLSEAGDVHAALKRQIADGRATAWQPLDKAIDDAIGSDRYEARKAADLFRQIADGLDAAAR